MLFLLCYYSVASAQQTGAVGDRPDGRGPDREGTWRDKGLPEKWSFDGSAENPEFPLVDWPTPPRKFIYGSLQISRLLPSESPISNICVPPSSRIMPVDTPRPRRCSKAFFRWLVTIMGARKPLCFSRLRMRTVAIALPENFRAIVDGERLIPVCWHLNFLAVERRNPPSLRSVDIGIAHDDGVGPKLRHGYNLHELFYQPAP